MKKQEAHTQNEETANDIPQKPESLHDEAEVVVAEAVAASPAIVQENEAPAEEEVLPASEDIDDLPAIEEETVLQEESHHAKAHHTLKKERSMPKTIGLAAGAVAVLLLAASALLSQYYKGKVMPGVVVAQTGVHAKNAAQLRGSLEPKIAALTIAIQSEEKTLEPTLEEIGISVDAEATVANTLQAKRHSGLLTKLAFWKKEQVPVVTAVDAEKFSQYIETNLPSLSKPPTDSRLTFDPESNQFSVTDQADGEGVAIEELESTITASLQQLDSPKAAVMIEKRTPKITQKALQPLVTPANALLQRTIVLSGAGYTFQARPADIAAWITPTPKDDGSIELVVDQSKIQAYVEAVGKRISQAPQDKKVLATESGEVILQTGRDGTELADREQLAKAIAIAVEEKRDLSQQMNIQVAAFKTINMEAFDRWVEVDLSEQRTTLYSGATPLQSFVVSSGLPQWPTVTGEFKVWHKNATQTMTGGSRATGDFYSLPNVTWVTYFYKDYGFHTAYWHNNFGQPMSHGCLNMREADAKILYDFAPIGTTVIVHH